jgi:predicted NAD/FAD-dependent oxidoreductase
VKRAERDGGAWTIEGSAGPADVLVLAMPPGDARSLVSVPGVDAVVVEPCLAVSCSFDERVSVEWDAAFVESSLLGWVARDSSKPGRPDGERWVLHGSPAWSREYFEASEGWVVEAALTEFRRLAGTAPKPTAVAVKRWRWALPTQPLGARHVWDPEQRLGLCGDWCGGPRVEGAWLSGTSLAGAILREFG